MSRYLAPLAACLILAPLAHGQAPFGLTSIEGVTARSFPFAIDLPPVVQFTWDGTKYKCLTSFPLPGGGNTNSWELRTVTGRSELFFSTGLSIVQPYRWESPKPGQTGSFCEYTNTSDYLPPNSGAVWNLTIAQPRP